MTQKVTHKFRKKKIANRKVPKSFKIPGGGGVRPGLENTQIEAALFLWGVPKSGCTRPLKSQSGSIFCHQKDQCVVFKSARQICKIITGRYENTHLEPCWQINLPIMKFSNKSISQKIPHTGDKASLDRCQ